MATELLEFPGGVQGIALNLEPDVVGAVIIGDYQHIEEGSIVKGNNVAGFNSPSADIELITVSTDIRYRCHFISLV